MEDNWRDVKFTLGKTEINIFPNIDAETCVKTGGIAKDKSCIHVSLAREDMGKIHPIPGPIDERVLAEKAFEHLPRVTLDRKTTMKILHDAREARIKAFEKAAQPRRE